MISIIGLGFVGSTVYNFFKQMGLYVCGYDIDECKSHDTFEKCLSNDIFFICLPTPNDNSDDGYDTSAIDNVMEKLYQNDYHGLIVIKSTVQPGYCETVKQMYPELNICHNPEFLRARCAYDDFCNQTHIIIGETTESSGIPLFDLYRRCFPDPKVVISFCSSSESEMVKIACNAFYATKITFFNEIYLNCKAVDAEFNRVRELMLKNERIHPSDTMVPGPDGLLGFGGMCFPKDTKALKDWSDKHLPTFSILKGVLMMNYMIRE